MMKRKFLRISIFLLALCFLITGIRLECTGTSPSDAFGRQLIFSVKATIPFCRSMSLTLIFLSCSCDLKLRIYPISLRIFVSSGNARDDNGFPDINRWMVCRPSGLIWSDRLQIINLLHIIQFTLYEQFSKHDQNQFLNTFKQKKYYIFEY